MGNTKKVVFSIVAIILAAVLITWQIKNMGPKKVKLTKEQQAMVDERDQKLLDCFNKAAEVAGKSGWDSTGSKYWSRGCYAGVTKKMLNTVFGKSFNPSDLENKKVFMDSECGKMCITFGYKGKNYCCHFVVTKDETKLYDFGQW